MRELSGRPLLDNEADRRLYVKRREHDVVARSAKRGLNLLLVGERGSGKTSLLRQVALDLREAGAEAVLIDGKIAGDAISFLELVRFELNRGPVALGDVTEGLRLALEGHARGADGLRSARLLELIEAINPDTPPAEQVTLLVDGLPSPEDAHALFGRLRDEIWRLPYNWVIAADDRTRAALMQPPADAFFDRVIQLAPLSHTDQRELLRRRASNVPAGGGPLFEAAEGNPRRLLALVRDAEEGERAMQDVLAEQVARESAASLLGRPASMLLAELEGLGAASASDEELLGRMGWTRGRAAQVFAELEEAGLVVSDLEKGSAGRPRKVFRPAPIVVDR